MGFKQVVVIKKTLLFRCIKHLNFVKDFNTIKYMTHYLILWHISRCLLILNGKCIVFSSGNDTHVEIQAGDSGEK